MDHLVTNQRQQHPRHEARQVMEMNEIGDHSEVKISAPFKKVATS